MPSRTPCLPQVLGCDFSSSPSRRKPIVVAQGAWDAATCTVQLQRFTRYAHLDDWALFLRQEGAWVGGFDLPFGLPRTLVEQLGWPTDWQACMQHYAALTRAQIREQFKAFCDARPAGGKFAHRATDIPAGSSPSMKWINPPVAYMLHAGVPRLLAAEVDVPGLLRRPSAKVALEAYPGMLARALLGRRSYKSDDTKRQTPERETARREALQQLLGGMADWPIRLAADADLQALVVADATGDHLVAVLCMLQAAWGVQQHEQGSACYGLPQGVDPLEGWIVTAPADTQG